MGTMRARTTFGDTLKEDCETGLAHGIPRIKKNGVLGPTHTQLGDSVTREIWEEKSVYIMGGGVQ